LTAFLAGDPVEVARAIIGWTFLIDGVGGPVVEAEAYREDDPASHSHRGRTPRNWPMFGPAGRLYVYRSYGIHWCVNVVCGADGYGAAVLLRALEPAHGVEEMRRRRGVDDVRRLCRGPGNVGQALAVGPELNGAPATLVAPARERRVQAGPRIGISRAVDAPWRFWDPDSPYVSRRPGAARSAVGRDRGVEQPGPRHLGA
jgi:DNA-3-methyladenine glycosylase